MFQTENDLWRIILPVIRAGVADFPGVRVTRAYQPSVQSDGESPRATLYRVSSRRYGHQGKKQEWRIASDGAGRMWEIDIWRKEDTFQVSALVDRAAALMPEGDGYTAKDVLEGLGAYLQSQPALDALREHGVGVLRVRDVTELPYEDDQEVWRVSVSLQFTLTYTQTRERPVPVVTGVEWKTFKI